MRKRKKILFDNSKLRGRIRGKFGSLDNLAKELGISAAAVISKINDNTDFTRSEIHQLIKLLGLAEKDIEAYFFDVKV